MKDGRGLKLGAPAPFFFFLQKGAAFSFFHPLLLSQFSLHASFMTDSFYTLPTHNSYVGDPSLTRYHSSQLDYDVFGASVTRNAIPEQMGKGKKEEEL